MAEPKLLISDGDWAEIQRLALERKTRGQTLMRDAVLNWLHGDRSDLRVPTPAPDAAKIRRAAATARQLAEQLESIVADAPPSEPMLSISYATLISMIKEITGGSNTSDAEAVAQRVRARLGKARGATADTTSSPSRRTGSE